MPRRRSQNASERHPMPWRDKFDRWLEVLAPRAALRRRQTRSAWDALHQDRRLASRRTPGARLANGDLLPEDRRPNWVPPRAWF
jgi:hypothetical protein